MITEYSRVRIITNRHTANGVPSGSVGYVIEVYDEGKFEVEFSDPKTGITFAQLVLSEAEIIESPESDS